MPLQPENKTTEYTLGKETVCYAEESACPKMSAEDNGGQILRSEGHDLHALLHSWPNCEYGLLQESDYAINLWPHSAKMARVIREKTETSPRQS